MPTAITHDPVFNTPVSSTNTAVVRWSGTSGSTLQDCGVLIDGSNNITGIGTIASGAITSSGAIIGTQVDILAAGDLRLQDSTGGQYVALEANGTTTTHTLTFPAAQGSASTFLQNNGSGGLTWAAAGGDLSFGGDTFGADKVIGSNDAYALSFETAGVVRMRIEGAAGSYHAAGAITMPTQPSVSFYNSAPDVNVTGNSAPATVDFDTEVFDQNGDFTADTFTAPVTGRYLVCFGITMSDVSAAATRGLSAIMASNRSWEINMSLEADAAAPNVPGIGGSAIIDMDVADTCHIQLRIGSMAGDTADIEGQSNPVTHVSVQLVA